MIAIKNMKNIPKRCVECGIKSGGYCYHKNPPYGLNEFNILKEKPDDCPLVEIITCKYCKHSRTCVIEEKTHRFCNCEKHRLQEVTDDYFCGDGKRRE